MLTIVDELELGDDVEAHIRKVILEHLKEHGEEVFSRSVNCQLCLYQRTIRNVLLLSEYRRKTANLVAKRSSNVLRRVGD